MLPVDAQAQNLVTLQRCHRFVVPYIPLFKDCYTFVCIITAQARGESTLPCSVVFEGTPNRRASLSKSGTTPRPRHTDDSGRPRRGVHCQLTELLGLVRMRVEE